jgi:hypothetical protein
MYTDHNKVNIQATQLTDEDGLTQVAFPIDNVQPNQVIEILITAHTPDGGVCTGQTWFRTWW